MWGWGSLTIKDIKLFNIFLFAKCMWRLGLRNDQGVLKDVLESKYKSWRNLNVMENNRYDSW